VTSDNFIFPHNDTLQTIKNRHSIRTFTDQEVSDDYISILLQAANEAPSAHNQQPWRFIVLRGEKKQELAHLVTSKAGEFPKPASALLRMAARSIMSAPVIIAVANTGELIERGIHLFKIEKDMAKDFFRTMEIQSSAAAVQNLLLAAHRSDSQRSGSVFFFYSKMMCCNFWVSRRASLWPSSRSVTLQKPAAALRNNRWR